VPVAPPAAALTESDVASAVTALGPLAPSARDIERAYVSLHREIRRSYVAAFRAVGKGKRGYVPTFNPEAQRGQRVLTQAPTVLKQATALEELSTALAGDLAAAPGLSRELAGRWPPRAIGLLFLGASANRASDLLSEAGGPFAANFVGFRRATVTPLDGLRKGMVTTPQGPRRATAVLPSAARNSPLLWLQMGLCHLLVVPFALQAVFAALPAGLLYAEVDGNAGVRAAATKLGSSLKDAYGRELADDDLLGLRTIAGSLEDYVGRLWRALGIDVRNPREEVVRTYALLAAQLVDAELRKRAGRGPDDRSTFKPDELESWDERESDRTFAVPRHLPTVASGTRLEFVPTWPRIVKSREFNVDENPIIMHADPGAQLGVFVACLLYSRAAEYVVPTDRKPSALPLPVVTAGCLQFGGAHSPHETHRSGAEADLDLADLRNLERDLFRGALSARPR
jgi:hypothetical protein